MAPKRTSHLTVQLTAPSTSTSTCTVHVNYDVNNPPPHPGPEWTRFVCISDTHSLIYPVPLGDVLLHSGDLSNGGTLYALEYTVEWLQKLPHPVKVFIGGNHDMCLDQNWVAGGKLDRRTGEGLPPEDIATARAMVRSAEARDAGLYYLEHKLMKVTAANGRTWEIYGSPAAPRYSTGAFQYQLGTGAALYECIPRSTEILLTHTPPYGIQDKTRRGKHAGCKELLARLQSEELRSCRLHVFGHIHESHGAFIGPPSADGSPGRVSVNAAVAYGRQAVIVDLKN